MAARMRLEIQGDAGNATFDVEGEWLPRVAMSYDEASGQGSGENYKAEPVEAEVVWEITKARLVSVNGSSVEVVAAWKALAARLMTSGGTRASSHPDYARMVDIASGNPTWTLGPSEGYERVRFEELTASHDSDMPSASWKATILVGLRVSAVMKLADVEGIVRFRQEADVRYVDGRRRLRWQTLITTKEGTSAVDKAKTFGVIPIASLGGDHTWVTNGPDGIDYTYTDAKEKDSRVPTVVVATSEVQQWGVTVGTVTPGGSPNDLEYTVVTDDTPEETITTTLRSARGPNALAWVEAEAPTKWLTRSIRDEKAAMAANGQWTNRVRRFNDALLVARVEITGGAEEIDFEPCANDLDPIEFRGGRQPFTVTVSITVQRRGSNLTRADLKFPGPLGGDWRFIQNESREDESPVRVDLAPLGFARDEDLYRREAMLVFRTAKIPTGAKTLWEEMRAVPLVESYFLGANKAGSKTATGTGLTGGFFGIGG